MATVLTRGLALVAQIHQQHIEAGAGEHRCGHQRVEIVPRAVDSVNHDYRFFCSRVRRRHPPCRETDRAVRIENSNRLEGHIRQPPAGEIVIHPPIPALPSKWPLTHSGRLKSRGGIARMKGMHSAVNGCTCPINVVAERQRTDQKNDRCSSSEL